MKSKLYGEQVDYNSLNELISNVWNYYNGRINVINPARLVVKFVCGNNINYYIDGGVAGRKLYPNTVELYPNTIIDSQGGNMNTVVQTIVEVIIHELYHIDQFILDSRACSVEYVNYIESQVDFQTYSYIMSNLTDIYNRFGVVMNVSFYNAMLHKINVYYPYNRVKVIDHIILGIDSMLMNTEESKPLIFAMIDIYNETNKDISYFINGIEIPIRKNGTLINISDYNNAINELWGVTTYKEVDPDNLYGIEIDDNKLCIYLNFLKAYNDLCRVIF